MSGAIDWPTAERVARFVSSRGQGALPAGYSAIHRQFDDFTDQAQGLVEAYTGWQSTSGRARARVVDREGWVRANIASFQRLLRPLTDRVEERLRPGVGTALASRAAGVEIGAMLGWMSQRVLGQYDLLVLEDENPDEQDIVYYVGPNIAALESKFEFPSDEFRLWVALHEVTHRTQFTGKPWLRDYFVEQTTELMTLADPDPTRFFAAIGRIAEGVRSRRNPLDDGLVTLFASTSQRAALDRVGGMMSLLEGHGDVTMDRAGGTAVPSAERFSATLSARRGEVRGTAKLVQKLVGLEAKMAQYAQGEAFIAALEEQGGREYLELAFAGPDNLPSLEEIREPQRWLQRVPAAVAI
ncbi:MAG: zinc-dependent metalloprotease [Microthrixaceae bacterium]|nr:zinc-dependent metalloprotease [Microthrixaceae bacterium]